MTECVSDFAPPRETNSVLSVRYDVNQFRAESESPMVECRRCMRMRWSTVSNAAVRSRRMRSDGEPASAVISRSLVTLTRAVSVLWPERKPDWNFSYRLLDLRWLWSWAATAFSSTFDKKGRLEIGRKLANTSGSRLGFLSSGLMTAAFRAVGT